MKQSLRSMIMIIVITMNTHPLRGVAETDRQDPQGEPISMKLVEVSLMDFLRVISEVSGLNILIDPDVKGSLTVNVEKVPWDQLLEAVLESYDLIRTQRGRLIRISRRDTLQKQKENRQALARESLLTKTKHLSHARGKTIMESLGSFLTERGQINLDERTNTLIIQEVPENMERISQLLHILDRPERQVEIEARIVEATKKFRKQLGVRLGFQTGSPTSRNQSGFEVLAPLDQPVGKAFVSWGGILDTFALDAVIMAAEAKGEARMISKPRVSTLNNTEARIVQGARIPVPVQMNYTTNVRYETAALQLSVRPQITGQGRVSLEINVENSVPDFTQTVRDIPTILTSESHTQVMVENGATTVIGGIFVETDRKSGLNVPGFSGLPLLGRLFRRSDKAVETREILFFITSTIQGGT